MSAHAHRHRATAEAQDLTRTTTLHEREFAPALRKRFRLLKTLVRKTVGYENDALQLTAAEPRKEFVFETRSDLIDKFQNWLSHAVDLDVVEVIDRERIRDGGHFTAHYVRAAYERGLSDATRRLAEAGVETGDADISGLFNLPVHQDALEQIYTRTFDSVDWIGTQTEQAIRQELTRALAEGRNPREVADDLAEEIEDVGITQATTLSRTEISNSYNTASANRYERQGVEQVRVLTHNPCPVCEELADDGPYPVSEAASLIPGRTHPNCVCTIGPVI